MYWRNGQAVGSGVPATPAPKRKPHKRVHKAVEPKPAAPPPPPVVVKAEEPKQAEKVDETGG